MLTVIFHIFGVENIVEALLVAYARNLVNSNEHKQWDCFTLNGVGLPIHVHGLPEPLAWIKVSSTLLHEIRSK
jgi:hypothetical protein